jgi:hypothetical protein
MAFDNSFTAVTGQTYTASQYNTHTKGNFTAIWVGTTAGDSDYYTSSTSKARLAIGAVGNFLGSTGTAPRWDDGTRYAEIQLNADVGLATGDGQGWFLVPPGLNGYNVTYVGALRASGGTGIPDLQLRRVRSGASADVLSTKVTIDSGEVWSGTAATAPVINASNDDMTTGDALAVDVDGAGTNTFYCIFVVGFKKP